MLQTLDGSYMNGCYIILNVFLCTLNIVQWQKFLTKKPTSPYITRGLLTLVSVMPGKAVVPQMWQSVWDKKVPLVVGSIAKQTCGWCGESGSFKQLEKWTEWDNSVVKEEETILFFQHLVRAKG